MCRRRRRECASSVFVCLVAMPVVMISAGIVHIIRSPACSRNYNNAEAETEA